MVGGVALVTMLRILQVPHKVMESARNPSPAVERDEPDHKNSPSLRK